MENDAIDIASTVLTVIPVLAIIAAWVIALKRTAPVQSPPLRIAQLLIRITPPVYAM